MPVVLSEVLPGTASMNGSASLSRNSGSGAVRLKVTVPVASLVTTPFDRSQVAGLAAQAAAPTMPL